MAQKTIIEVVYGKYHKYEVIKESTAFSIRFNIYKDGKYYRGYFSSLSDAVDAARRER